MTATLRGALARLRSQEVEELGLEASLAQLVAGWNAQKRTGRRPSISTSSATSPRCPRRPALSIYRIAQECLTNAARHGKPQRRPAAGRARRCGGRDAVAVSVEDDGGGTLSRLSWAPGYGILGIRERVTALGGSLSIEPGALRRARRRPDPAAARPRGAGRGMTELTILLVDDHPVVREGYRRLLERTPGYRSWPRPMTPPPPIRPIRRRKPDVVVMDLSLPGIGGIEALRHIRQWDRDARILIFTMHSGAGFALKAFEAGAAGYVTKGSDAAELVSSVAVVARGGRAMSDDVARRSPPSASPSRAPRWTSSARARPRSCASSPRAGRMRRSRPRCISA